MQSCRGKKVESMVWNPQANYKLSYWITYSPQTSWYLCWLFVVVYFFFFNLQLKQAGSVCRASAGECDLPEYCTGASQDCPDDSFQMNGKPCYNQAEGYCHDGQCPTHQQHCWRLFGPGTPVHPAHPAHPAGCCVSGLYLVRPSTTESNAKLKMHNDLYISNWSVSLLLLWLRPPPQHLACCSKCRQL